VDPFYEGQVAVFPQACQSLSRLLVSTSENGPDLDFDF